MSIKEIYANKKIALASEEVDFKSTKPISNKVQKTITFTGALTTGLDIPFTFSYGIDSVDVFIGASTDTADADSALTAPAGSIPVQFRPTTPNWGNPIGVADAAVGFEALGAINFQSDGSITIHRAVPLVGGTTQLNREFTTGTPCGIRTSQCVQYCQ